MSTQHTDSKDDVKPKLVTVSVNGNDVEVPHKVTGSAIKTAAIRRGVPVEQDFNLFRKRGTDYDPVADDDEITTHKGEEFRCVAPDDVA